MHRSIFDKVGYYDMSLRSSEDYEFWLRACLIYDIRLYLIQRKTLLYRRHPDQLTRKIVSDDTAIRSKILNILPAEKRSIYG